jgi:hypothetical protein
MAVAVVVPPVSVQENRTFPYTGEVLVSSFKRIPRAVKVVPPDTF